MMGNADDRSDTQLIEAINDGDESAFDVLYERHRDWVARLAYRFTQHHDDALDALQDTFLYFIRRFPHFELTVSLRTFLYPVVKHSALAAIKKRKRMIGLELDPEMLAMPSETEDSSLTHVLRTLSAEHREVILMRFVDDLQIDEMADALGIPLGTAKSRLHHALRLLRENPGTRRYFL
jgi:RNA polymerase sigma-70 factor (ECF subfamily)